MTEYRGRRERRHAQGGKVKGEGHPTAHKGPVLVIGLLKKKKDGGHVEGKAARGHLGKRARGGRTEPRLTKQLDAREAAFDSDGVDKVAEGSGRDEREVPIEERRRGGRADGGATQDLTTVSGKTEPKLQYLARPSKFGADDDYGRNMGNLTPPKRDSPNKYEVDDDRASGGRLTAGERRKMPSSEFALPGKGDGPGGKGSGAYPIPDRNHGRDALARVSQHGSPAEKAKVRAAVHRKFPDIHESE